MRMKYIIIDWMYNVCFDSDLKDMQSFEDADEWLDEALRLECGNNDADLEELREDYHIEEFNPELDRIMCVGMRYVLKKDYYKAIA